MSDSIPALTDEQIAALARITPQDIARANADLRRHPELLTALEQMESTRRRPAPAKRRTRRRRRR